jgi:hypothetical protein
MRVFTPLETQISKMGHRMGSVTTYRWIPTLGSVCYSIQGRSDLEGYTVSQPTTEHSTVKPRKLSTVDVYYTRENWSDFNNGSFSNVWLSLRSCPCIIQFINEELYNPYVNHISQIRFPSIYLHVTRKQGVTSDSEGSNVAHTLCNLQTSSS